MHPDQINYNNRNAFSPERGGNPLNFGQNQQPGGYQPSGMAQRYNTGSGGPATGVRGSMNVSGGWGFNEPNDNNSMMRQSMNDWNTGADNELRSARRTESQNRQKMMEAQKNRYLSKQQTLLKSGVTTVQQTDSIGGKYGAPDRYGPPGAQISARQDNELDDFIDQNANAQMGYTNRQEHNQWIDNLSGLNSHQSNVQIALSSAQGQPGYSKPKDAPPGPAVVSQNVLQTVQYQNTPSVYSPSATVGRDGISTVTTQQFVTTTGSNGGGQQFMGQSVSYSSTHGPGPQNFSATSPEDYERDKREQEFKEREIQLRKEWELEQKAKEMEKQAAELRRQQEMIENQRLQLEQKEQELLSSRGPPPAAAVFTSGTNVVEASAPVVVQEQQPVVHQKPVVVQQESPPPPQKQQDLARAEPAQEKPEPIDMTKKEEQPPQQQQPTSLVNEDKKEEIKANDQTQAAQEDQKEDGKPKKKSALTEEKKQELLQYAKSFLEKLNKFDEGFFEDKERIVYEPIPVCCAPIKFYIERNKSGFNKLYPKYTFYKQQPGFADIPLMVAKKRSGQTSANYMVSLNIANPKAKGKGYLGKVRHAGQGVYNVYGPGENPQTCQKDITNIRDQYLYTEFNTSQHPAIGMIRKMKLLIPKVDPYTNKSPSWKPLSEKKDFMSAYLTKENQHWMMDNPPKWSEDRQMFVLDFGGRVTEASIKNFQLIDYVEQKDPHKQVDGAVIKMQFGRISENQFNVDVKHPLSIFQAFCLAVCAFDY